MRAPQPVLSEATLRFAGMLAVLLLLEVFCLFMALSIWLALRGLPLSVLFTVFFAS